MTIAYSASRDHMEGKPKVYTHGFEHEAATLQKLSSMANQFAIAGAKFSDGHRKSSSIVSGSNLILIDCDEPGQSEAVEAKLKYYTYVKVPSASNLTHDYKWHYFVPTQETLSTFPAAYKWQVEQFFNQVGITASMVDTTGSYDIARQFAPACIGMTVEEATERTYINDGLSAPVLIDVPVELNTVAAKSITLKDVGTNVKELPADHLWYENKALSYEAINVAVKDAGANTIVSGFGCPHNNKAHTGDATHSYGFAYQNKDGSVTVKCTGNECSVKPYFNVPDKSIPEPIEDKKEVIELEPVKTPVNPIVFADGLKAQLIEYNPKFVVSGKMMKVFQDYASMFNTVVNDNTAKTIPVRQVIPLTTGSAKTTAMKRFMAMCGVSGIVVVRKAMTAVEVVRDINMMAGKDIARCYYSPDAKSGRPDTAERVDKEDLCKYQVIVITHAMFERVHDAVDQIVDTYRLYNGSHRKAVIIDERIDLKREESFDNREVADLIALLDRADTTGKYAAQISWLTGLNEDMFSRENIKTKDKSNFVHWSKEMQKVMRDKPVDALTSLIEAIDKRDLILTERTHIRGLRNRGSDSMKYEDAAKALMKRMRFVITGHMMLSKQGTTTNISRVEDFSLLFGSVVILDATANINKVYEVFAEYQPKQFIMYDKPAIRNYQNATLHIGHGEKQSKQHLYGATKTVTAKDRTLHIVKKALAAIYAVVEPGDNMLVVVHKSALPIFNEHNRMPNVTFINWGQHAGSNQWSHYNKAMIFGWYRIPSYLTANNMNAAAGGYHNLDMSNYDKDVKELADSAIADDMVQFLNRTRTRVSIDEGGNCEPVDLYLFTDDTRASNLIVSRVIKEFDHLKVKDWDITLDTSKKKRRPKAEERADNIIDLLKMASVKHDDVMADSIRQKLGTTRDAFNRTLKSDYMQKELSRYNIIYKRLKGVSGSPAVFDMNEAKSL